MGFFDRKPADQPTETPPGAEKTSAAGGVLPQLAAAREKLKARDVAGAMAIYEAVLAGAGELGVDAAFIGNTTFGAGLPGGAVTREEFDACVRFDGAIYTAEVDGARLRELLAAANLEPESPFELRRGEFSFADGRAEIDPAKTYRIATTDWGAKNTARYFGEPAISWREQPGLKLKAAVLPALALPAAARPAAP